MNNSSKDFVYKLLFRAIIEMREEAYIIGNKKIFWIANLIHNLPLDIKDMDNQSDFEKIWKDLKEKAEKDGMKDWLQNRENDITSSFTK